MKQIHVSEIDFEGAVLVAANATKFLAPICLAITEPLIHPETKKPLTRDGKPFREEGVVIYNRTDNCYQGLLSGEFLLFNNPTSEQADLLYRWIYKVEPWDDLYYLDDTVDGLVKKGINDFYPVTFDYCEKVDSIATDNYPAMLAGRGGYVRKKALPVLAQFVPGSFVLTGGPADQVFSNGAYVIEEAGKRRGVQPDVFEQTYVRLK